MQEAAEPHAPLYDAYAGRLHAYCWSLVGDDAPSALREAFVTAARQGPPRTGTGTPLWLYGLARTACVRRGALDRAFTRIRDTDPLRHAAAGLRADHREVLVLSAGGWLEVPDIAQLLGVATDTVTQLIRAARKRLERGVLDVLLPGPVRPEYEEIIAAFEKGALDVLLARRAPEWPPAALRADVLAACDAEAGPRTRPLPAVQGPLVVIGPGGSDEFAARRRPGRALAGTVGLAAAAAAAVGVFAALPVTGGGSAPRSSGQNLLVPTASGTRVQTSTAAQHSVTTPQQTGASPATSSSVPYSAPGATATTPPGVPAEPQSAPGGPATTGHTPPGHLSSPTLSSSASASASASATPVGTPSATPTDSAPSTPSSTPADTPQASPTPLDTPTPETTPSP
jgi:DNA-directed RNA polymerase specialized sigma24 family protein